MKNNTFNNVFHDNIFSYCRTLPNFQNDRIVAYFLGENILYNSIISNFKNKVFSG